MYHKSVGPGQRVEFRVLGSALEASGLGFKFNVKPGEVGLTVLAWGDGVVGMRFVRV